MKLGRNAPCWCGSSKKYKRCHLDRDKAEPTSKQSVLQKTRKAFGAKYCLHPEASQENCRGNIVRAHTIQRSGGLSRIAQDNHVYNFLLHERFHVKPNKESEEPTLIGVKQASTFTGFCGYHDNDVFAPLEKQPFQCSQEQVFLLGYRVLCKELFLKRATLELEDMMRQLDRGRGFQVQRQMQWEISEFMDGVKKAINELADMKAIHDEMLLSRDFANIRYAAILFDQTPEVLCSGVNQPEFDFVGNRLQEIDDLNRELEWLHFSLIATDMGGCAIFSWLAGSPIPKKFVTTLLEFSDDSVPHAIVRYAFEYFENTYFSPPWWSALAEPTRTKLKERARAIITHSETCLVEDDFRTVKWMVRSRLQNILQDDAP